MKSETGIKNENDKRSTLAEAHAEDGNLCSCTYMQEVSGEQEEIAEHLLFDCEALYTCFRFYLSIRRRS